ncbi:transposase [Pseudoxanthomonas mexicana]
MGFFKRLIKDADRKVFPIPDNMEDQIEVLYLPSYSPELNPYECLNADLK